MDADSKSNLNSEDLRLFFLVHDGGGISAASRRHGLSKAKLSRALTRLESAANATLFDRVGGGLRLTEVGFALLAAAEKAARSYNEAEQALREVSDVPRGELHIMVEAALGASFVGGLVADLVETYPEIDAHVEVIRPSKSPQSNADIRLEFGVKATAQPYVRSVARSPLYLYAGTRHVAAVDGDKVADLSRTRRVMVAHPVFPSEWKLSDGSPNGVYIDAPVLATVDDPSVACAILRSTPSIALLPALCGDRWVDSGVLARVLPRFEGSPVELIATLSPERARIPAVRACIEMMLNRYASR